MNPNVEHFEWVPVTSSNIAAVAYSNHGTLGVRFHSGKSFLYDQVPADVHKALMAAPSIGKFFAAEIRGKYPPPAEEAQGTA